MFKNKTLQLLGIPPKPFFPNATKKGWLNPHEDVG